MIRKAVIPVAGVGSRLLPLTKSLPKEMLPVGDKPVLEHTIRELADSGVTDIIIVTSPRKAMIQSHFAPDPDLERQLIQDGKDGLAKSLREVSSLANIVYLHQDGPYGNGTPIVNAAPIVGDEPFMVLWGDDVFVADVPRAQQLIAAYERVEAPILALMEVPPEDVSRYGVAVTSDDLGEGLLRVTGLVEKPRPEKAPSRYAAIGGYVVTPAVVAEIRKLIQNWTPGQEIYLSEALHAFAANQPVYGQVISGTWYDTGTPLNYLRAQFAAALAHPEYGPELRKLARETG